MDLQHGARAQAPGRDVTLVVAGCLLAAATGFGGFRAVVQANRPADGPRTLQLDGARLDVIGVDEVVGVAAADLMGGMSHNISGAVGEDQLMVRVSVRIAAGDAPVSYDANQLVARAVGSRAPIEPVGGTLGHGFLTTHGQVEGSVTFVVPRDGAHLVLGTRDSSRTIELAEVDRATTEHSGHAHHESTR